jgi:molybdopterin-guanine dinucleotide biosynthesis protein A
MHGTPKGLLQPPGEGRCLVERLIEQLVAAGVHSIVLVGRNQAYDRFELPCVSDALLGQGPLAGLLGLVEYALPRSIEFTLALACDMPRLNAALIRRLIEEQPRADAFLPRRQRWEPLCARYRASAVRTHVRQLLEAGQYRMSALLDALGTGCSELPLTRLEQAALFDWDSPMDLPTGVRFEGKPLATWER